MAVAAGMAVVASLLWMNGISMTSLSSGTAAIPDWQVSNLGVLAQTAGVWLFAMALVPMALGRRVAQRIARNRPPTAGPHTLLLRNFTDDLVTLTARRLDRANIVDAIMLRRKESFEEIEAAFLAKYGHPYAVGRPGERLPPALGATRLYFSDSEWQGRVLSLAADARLVAVTVGRSPWLIWEMQYLLKQGLLPKTVFLLPPVGSAEARRRLAMLAAVLGCPPALLDAAGTGRDVIAVCVPRGCPPHVVVAATADDLSYDLALEDCVEALSAPSPTDGDTERAAVAAGFGVGLPAPTPLAPGSKRSPKPWGRMWLWVTLANILILPFFMSMITGSPLGQSNLQTIAGPVGVTDLQLLMAQSDRVWYLVDHRTVVTQKLPKGDAPDAPESLGTLPGPVSTQVANSDMLFAITLPTASQGPTVIGWDMSSHSLKWTRAIAELPRELTVTGSRVYLVQPIARTVVSFDAATGTVGPSASVDCLPWSVRPVLATLIVSCPRESYAIQLKQESLQPSRRLEVPVGTVAVLEWAREPWALSRSAAVIQNTTNPELQIWLRRPSGFVTTLGDVLAVEGIERVSIFTSKTVTRRDTYPHIGDIVVASSGEIAFTDDRGVVFVRLK